MHDALRDAGFSSSIMNNDNIPLGMVNMGLEKGKVHLSFVMRAILFADPTVGKEYLTNLSDYVKVFRITSKNAVTKLQPWPIPTLKRRETDTTAFDVLPNTRNEMTHLRNEIIKKYSSAEYNHVDLETDLWIIDGYVATVMDYDTIGDNRDAAYLRTETYQLTSDDDFVILYGVNHEQTGKAIINNASFYGVELFNGEAVGQISAQFENSAVENFPEGYDNGTLYYVCEFSRKEDGDSILVPYSSGNTDGKAYGVDNHKDAFNGYRLYVDKEALIGPAHMDVIWDRAILFTKKKGTETLKGKNERKNQSLNISVKIGSNERAL
jgi:hypothetical protein